MYADPEFSRRNRLFFLPRFCLQHCRLCFMLHVKNAVPITVGDVSHLFLAGQPAKALQRTIIVLFCNVVLNYAPLLYSKFWEHLTVSFSAKGPRLILGLWRPSHRTTLSSKRMQLDQEELVMESIAIQPPKALNLKHLRQKVVSTMLLRVGTRQ